MAGSCEAKQPEVAYLSASHRRQVEIEEHLVASGRHSLEMQTFDDQRRLRSTTDQTQLNSIKWEIWEHWVWTPGYVRVYAHTRRLVNRWADTLLSEMRADYGERFGIYALRRDEEALQAQVNADLPKRMYGLLAIAKVNSLKRSYAFTHTAITP